MRATQRRFFIPAITALLFIAAGASAWGAVTGVISGVVTDAETKALLSGANVGVVEAGLNTVTDGRGRFVITNVPPGSYTVSVSLIGYRTSEVTGVSVVQGQVSPVEVGLEATVVEAAGAEARVTAARVALRRDVTSSVYVTTAADEQMTLSQPNDRYQFPGLVFAQPGVVPDNTFYPHVRGARSRQVGYFLDGIPITEPNHNVFATNIVSIGLDRLELFTGGYPAEYGGFTGGIVNQVVKRGDQMRGALLDVGAGSPYDFGGALLETGDVDGRANWYYGLYTWHTKFNENLFTTAAPTVSDHIAKVIYDVGPRDRVTALSHHGYARYLFPYERVFTFDRGESDWLSVREGPSYARQGHDLDALGLNHTISPRSFWNLRVSRLRHFLELELGDLDNLYWLHRGERMLTTQFDYEAQVGDHRLRAGVWQINSDNDSVYSVYLMPTAFVAETDTRNTQAYLQDTWELGDRLTLTIGGRSDRMRYDRTVGERLKLSETSVRAGATYEASPSVLVRGSYGRYVEFPRADLIGYRFEGMDLDWYTWFMLPEFPVLPQLDRGRELGVEFKLGESTLATVSWFQRDSRQMMQKWLGASDDPAGFDETQPARFASNGTGTTRGVEVKVDRRLSQELRGWLAYTRMDATATSGDDNLYPFYYAFHYRTDPEGLAQEFPVDWNQKDTVATALRWQRGKLTVNPWVTYGSGFPYGQSGLEVYDPVQDAYGSDPAHVPNPNYDPSDPTSLRELVVPENYVDASDPSKGFVAPNSLETGKNLTVSLNLTYEMKPGRQLYLQIYNLFARDDVTSKVIYHPRTGALLGRIEGDRIYYVPFAKTPPRFFAFGVRQEF